MRKASTLLIFLTLIAIVAIIQALPSARAKWISPTHSAVPEDAIDIQVDGATTYQTIEGFGVNANSRSWDLDNPESFTPQIDALIDETGATIWRVVVESEENWETPNDNDNPFSFNQDYYNELYEKEKFRKLWAMLAYIEARGVPTIYLSVMGCLPDWMGDIGNACTLPADGSHDDEWVEMMASLVDYARNTKQLRIDLFNPINEQDHPSSISHEGPRISPTHYVTIMEKLSERLDTLGMGDLRFGGPDIAKTDTAPAYLSAMAAASPALMAKFSQFAAHRYDSGDGGLVGQIESSAYPDLSPWISEYSGLCANFKCDNGEQVTPEEHWQFTIDTFDYLLSYLNDGVTAGLAWEAYDSYYEHHANYSYWGLISYDPATEVYTPTTRLAVARHAYRFIERGMQRIATTNGASATVSLSAFRDSRTGKITLVGRNISSSPQTLSITLSAAGTPETLQLYETTQQDGWQDGGSVTPGGNSYVVNLAAKSMFTLTNVPLEARVSSFLPFIRQ